MPPNRRVRTWKSPLATVTLVVAMTVALVATSGVGAAGEVGSGGGVPEQAAHRLGDQILDPTATARSNFSGSTNVATFSQDSILTYRGWQYVSWYQEDGRAAVARRELPTGGWQSLELDFTLLENDSHNTISMGVSPSDGVLHIFYGQHVSPHRYTRTGAGALDDPASVTWSAALFSPTVSGVPGVTGTDPRMTYPTLETAGETLLLTWREGGDQGGVQVLASYDGTDGTWDYHGAYSSGAGRFTHADGRVSPARNGYLHTFEYNPATDRLEIVWTYREQQVPGAVCLSRDLLYASSPDRGMTWFNSAGEQIGSTGVDPVTTDDAAVVVDIPGDVHLVNQETATADNAGRMHVITSRVPDDVRTELGPCPSPRSALVEPFHHWRDASGVWHTMQIPLAQEYGVGRSNIEFDSDDSAYVVLPNAAIIAATAASGWTDWSIVFDAADLTINKETLVDRQRIGQDGVLTVGYQEASEDQTSTMQSPAAFRVADFALEPGEDRGKDVEPQPAPIPFDGLP